MTSNGSLVVSRNIDNHDLVVRETETKSIVVNLSVDTDRNFSPERRYFLAHVLVSAQGLLSSLRELLPLARNEAEGLNDVNEHAEAFVAKEKIERAEKIIASLEAIDFAYKTLKKACQKAPDTIINSCYLNYLERQENGDILKALLVLTGKETVKDFLSEYDGFTLEKLINA